MSGKQHAWAWVAVATLIVAGCHEGDGAVDTTLHTAFMSAIENMPPDYEPSQLLSGACIGLDFDVGFAPIEVTALGVYDWKGDGLASDHWVCIYDRDGTLVHAEYVSAGEGYLEEGFRFVDLDEPVVLPPWFRGSVVVGYFNGNHDLNANVHGSLQIDPPVRVDEGGGIIRNVGQGRWGLDPEGFADVPDEVYGPGPANRYHGPSFRYRRALP